MTTYIVTRKSDGQEVYRYANPEPVEWAGMSFALYDHTAIPDDAPVVAPTGPRKITKFAYRKRFTAAEKAAIEMACLDDPTKPMAQRAMAASLRASQLDAMSATFIDLTPGPLLEETRAAMMPLEALGLLAAGRVSVILDTAPTDKELFHE